MGSTNAAPAALRTPPKRMTAKTNIEKKRFAMSGRPSPSVRATTALPPVPSMKPTAANQHRDREHDVDRAQTDVSDHVGHKKSVRDAVQRGQDHHGDARERKTKQTAEGKVV